MAATGPSSPDTTKETPATTDTKMVESATNNAVTTAAAQAAPPAKGPAAMMPTYLSTKQSKAYTLSKQLLSSGSLDDALSTLEMTLQLSREMLANSFAAGNNNNNDDDDDLNIELHESLAPLYYLYGTTLLYSVEESDVMMANGKQQGGGAVEDVEVPAENEAHDNDDDDDENENNEEPAAADSTEDLQIAWENLDLARSIVSRLVDTFHNIHNNNDATIIVLKSDETINTAFNNYTPAQQTTLLLDLAQIHTRLGDLQRANANVLPCIDDYNLALQLRSSCLGGFDQKVADSHFSLAAVYAEAPNQVDENEGKVDEFVNSLGGAGAGAGEKQELSEEEKVEFRHLSLEHYLACGVAFSGLMAKMCGEDAETLTQIVENNACTSTAVASAAAASSTTVSTTSSNHHSKTMATLRQRLSKLQPPTSDKEEFNNLKEMLDEIQEAIDSAEETEEGLKSLSEMKANEIKKHEMKSNGGEEGGSTTTIGFGAASTSYGGTGAGTGTVSSSSVNAFGSTLSAAASATAPTMMIVKKKKKKPQPSEDESAKRLKTN